MSEEQMEKQVSPGSSAGVMTRLAARPEADPEAAAALQISYAENATAVSPFVRTTMSTATLMFLMLVALLPVAGLGVYRYGFHALVLLLISTGTAIAAEFVYNLIAGRGITILDYSAAVSGLILGLILPPSVPYYFALLGSAAGIIGAKCAFGGLGRNILNPAITGKLLLTILFRQQMNDFSACTYPKLTPLTQFVKGESISLTDMLTGNCAADIGTGCTIAILTAAAFLILTGVIDGIVPAFSVIGFIVTMILFGKHGWSPVFLSAELMGGGFLFTAFFMGSDYTTTPVTVRGKRWFGFLFGIFTALLRLAGFTEDAVVFALIIMNLMTRFLDRHTMPAPFGKRRPVPVRR